MPYCSYSHLFSKEKSFLKQNNETLPTGDVHNVWQIDLSLSLQDLTITVASEMPSYEVELIEDLDDHHVVNKQSFVDEQEWHLYMHTECSRRDLVIDQADNSVRRSALSVKCRAARRPGYFVWNIFLVTVRRCLNNRCYIYALKKKCFSWWNWKLCNMDYLNSYSKNKFKQS